LFKLFKEKNYTDPFAAVKNNFMFSSKFTTNLKKTFDIYFEVICLA